MRLKRFAVAAVVAAAAVCAFSASVFADLEKTYDAVIGFSDALLSVQDWETSTVIAGDGQYTIESALAAGAQDIGVLVIDIKEMSADVPEAAAVLDKIEIDGTEIEFDADKILYGNLNGSGSYRIEIFDQYSSTKNAPALDQTAAVNSSLKVTFTVSGLGTGVNTETSAYTETETSDESAAEETSVPEADAETVSSSTGNASSAVMLAVIAAAGASAIVSKKRK